MKICKLYLPDFQQFKHLELDFTHPETGEPLDKICLIGPNGTGKTTLLEFLIRFLQNPQKYFIEKGAIQILVGGRKVWCVATSMAWEVSRDEGQFEVLGRPYLFLDPLVEQEPDWQADLCDFPVPVDLKQNSDADIAEHLLRKYDLQNKYGEYVLSIQAHESIRTEIQLNPQTDLLVYDRAEAGSNQFFALKDVPTASVDEALALLQTFPVYHEVSASTISDFWRTLIYHLKLREQQREGYERQPENLEKTKRQLIDEFDREHPDIMERLAGLWNGILAQAGLELDLDSISHPVQLTDNLKAYIRVKATGEQIPYQKLSTGIRNFLFRFGHVYSLFFERDIKRGFLFVDEPENSLFPDLLLGLVDLYRQVTTDRQGEQKTQIFMATHNPLVAAQFQPYERIILDWKEDGTVSARRGSAPVGDDPNDVLRKDFEISSLLGPEGQKMWERYLNLRRALRQTQDPEDKKRLLSEISTIGNAYEFDA